MATPTKSRSNNPQGARLPMAAVRSGSDDAPRQRLARLILINLMAIALIPLAAMSAINFLTAREAILETENDYLSTIGIRQVNEIRTYFDDLENFVSLVGQSPGAIFSLQSFGDVDSETLPTMLRSPAFTEMQTTLAPLMNQFVDRFGFSQLYLINPQGIIIHALPYLDPTYRDLNTSPNNSTELAAIYRRTTTLLTNQASDYRIFPPLNQPALFLSTPVTHEGNYLGCLVLAIDNQQLSRKLTDVSNLGKSAEIILASQDEDDILLLNDLRDGTHKAFSRFLPLKPDEGEPPVPTQRAIHGESGSGMTLDHRGNEVLALWDYLPNLRVGVVLKVDKSEVFAPVHRLLINNILMALVTAALVTLVALYLSRIITRPINILTHAAKQLANGDLSADIPACGNNEVGQLANAARTMSRNLKSLVGKVKVIGSEISKTAQFISNSARQQVDAAQQTGTSAVEVNTTAKQIATTARELADTMREVNQVTQETALKAEAGLDVLASIQDAMKRLAQANSTVSDQLSLIQTRANAITGIITTMTKVADQTNLLSLNASIEARKAGEYGRGFSVVAEEIQRLADQAAASTLEIEGSVKDMLGAVRTGVKGMNDFSHQVSQSVQEITRISARLTEVIQQVQGLPPRFDLILEGMQSQAEGAVQINEAMSQLSQSAQQTAHAIKETHRMLDSLRRSSEVLEGEIARFKT